MLKQNKWTKILFFYIIILLGTFSIRILPNFINYIFKDFIHVSLPWNVNHGIIIFIITFIFYKFSDVKKESSFIGNSISTFIFPSIVIVGYSLIGIENNFGINKHIWAFIFISITFIYDIMEEYTWRGY